MAAPNTTGFSANFQASKFFTGLTTMGRKSNSRNNGFWFWAARNGWYHTCPTTGTRISLKVKGKENKAQAQQRYCQIQAQGGVPALVAEKAKEAIANVDQLAQAFLDCRKGLACHDIYTSNLRAFRLAFGLLAPSAMTEGQIVGWINGQKKANGEAWSYSQKVGVKKILKAMFSFAASERLVDKSPLRDLKAGQTESRTATFSADQTRVVEKWLATNNPAFLAVFQAMHFYARPGELFKLTAADIQETEVDGEAVLVAILAPEDWKNGQKTGKPRTIYFDTKEMVATVKALVAQYPTGPIFRTTKGKAWTTNSSSHAMEKVRKACNLGDEFCLYTTRHTCFTEALRNNMPTNQLCLAGGTSAAMLDKHYGHLNHEDVIRAMRKKGAA